MSQENVEIVREYFEIVNDGDFGRAMRYYADDVELVVPAEAFLEAGTFRGKDAVGLWFGNWFRAFQRGYQFDLDEIREVGDSSVRGGPSPRSGKGQRRGGPLDHRLPFPRRGRAYRQGRAVPGRPVGPRSSRAVGARRSRRLLSPRDARATSKHLPLSHSVAREPTRGCFLVDAGF